MSSVAVRAALEVALSAMSPPLATAWENAPFTPVPLIPFQQVNLLLAEPINREYGARYQDQGFMQVSLAYPELTGSAAAGARAELLRSTFARGNTFTSGATTVTIIATPSISYAGNEGGRYMVRVKIRFSAQ